MGRVLIKKDTRYYARLQLKNGDEVMISVAQSGVKVWKMKWAGLLPVAVLWASRSPLDVVETFLDPDKPTLRPLDSIIAKLIDCESAAALVAELSKR